jgi:hypothetical protein
MFVFLVAKNDALDAPIASVIIVFIVVGAVAELIAMYKLDATSFDTYIPLLQSIDHDKTKVISENGDVKEIYITVNGEEYHFEIEEGE